MSEHREAREGNVPLGQRILDSPILLLVVGFLVTAGFYTIWGLIEIFSLPPATLP